MQDGMAKMFGPTKQVIEELTKQQQQAKQAIAEKQQNDSQSPSN